MYNKPNVREMKVNKEKKNIKSRQIMIKYSDNVEDDSIIFVWYF